MSASLHLYVYGVVRRGAADLGSAVGLGDAPLEPVPAGEVEAIVSRHADSAAFAATEDALVRHDAVCTALMEATAVAPARFGTVFGSEAELVEALAPREKQLVATLERLDGKVELGVRALRPSAAATDAATGSGTAYLRARLMAEQEAKDVARAIEERLAPLAVAHASRVGTSPHTVVAASYLVERGSVERFRAAVQRLDGERPAVTLVCTGPWPPYTFVDGPA